MSETNVSPVGSEAIKWRLFFMGVIGPLLAVSVGVDGGDIFQILAVDTLRLEPRAVGLALLFGALSIPVQVLAARIPLRRARHNIRLFLWLQGIFGLVTALVIVWAEPGSVGAGTVLVIAVLAEIAVSVLYATSWQPIIAYTLTVDQRQFINGRSKAVTGGAMLAAVVLFGQLNQYGRAGFVAVLGLLALAVGWSLRVLPPPPADAAPEEARRDTGTDGASVDRGVRARGPLTDVFVALAAAAFASWPLLVSYAAVTLWPTGNLGVLAGALVLGSIVGSALWRDPGHRLTSLIRVTAGGVALCSLVIAALGPPVKSGTGAAVLMAAVAIGSAARTALRTAVMELAHRRIDPSNSVRVMTLLDVVGSTSFQVGAFIAGFLISAGTDGWGAGLVDPYQLWLLITAAVLTLTAVRFRSDPYPPPAGSGSGHVGQD